MKWTLPVLESLNTKDLFELTRRALKTLAVSRLLLGRCLLTIDSTGVAGEVGCSGSIHYAGLHGIEHREAREARRVARCLEELPLLRKAAEEGAVDWSKLRCIVGKATPDTDAQWLEIAKDHNYEEVQRISSRTQVGGVPSNQSGPEVDPVETMLKCWLNMTEASVFHAVIRSLSQEAGRPVSFKEHLEILWVQHLTGAYSPESARKIWESAEKDVAAHRHAQVVEEAPWAAVGSVEVECPGEPGLSPVKAAPVPHWTNDRLRFNGEARGVTPAQRKEVMRRDGYCCATPGCPNHLWLEVHHIVFYCRGGATVLQNLVVLCWRCHANIHKGLLTVRGTAPEALRWSNRQGFAVGGVKSGSWLGLLDTG